MSINVELREVESGSDELRDEAWELKERIRAEDGVLKQRRGFFDRAYRNATVYGYRDPEADELIGFAAVRRDGYMLFLAVSPEHRDQGFGERLVARVAEDHRRVTCHARTTNEGALGFYDRLGFEIVRRIDGYYEDGGNAYYLALGSDGGLRGRLSSLLGR